MFRLGIMDDVNLSTKTFLSRHAVHLVFVDMITM